MQHYDIVVKKQELEDVVRQLRAINEFPCIIQIYDRVFKLDTKDECWTLVHGVEIGWYLMEEKVEAEETKKPPIESISRW